MTTNETATPASVTYTFFGGGKGGGTFTIETLEKGKHTNGILATPKRYWLPPEMLTGFFARMWISENPDFIQLQLWRGGFSGLDESGNSVYVTEPRLLQKNNYPQLLLVSEKFNNLADLYRWFETDKRFSQHFRLSGIPTLNGTGAVDRADLIANSELKPFAGGTGKQS